MTLYSRAETDAQSLKLLNTTEKNSVDKYDHDNTLIVDGDSTVAGAQGYSTAARRVVFIDETEATLAENKERGLTAPGWWEYFTYTDSSGKTRHKAQHLVSFKSAPANAADADDDVAADVAVLIAINTQPADTSVATGAALQLVVDAISTPPADAYFLSISGRRSRADVGSTSVLTNQLMMLLFLMPMMLVHTESRLHPLTVAKKSFLIPLL